MRNFLISSLIICSSLFSNELPKNLNSLDVYSEYNYAYYNDGTHVRFYNLLKYQYNLEKKQYGFRDILLYSLREIATEAKRLGYENFFIEFINGQNKTISVDEYLNNYNPVQYTTIYPYSVGKRESSGIGSVLSLTANVALGAAALKSASSGNNVSASSNVFGQSLNGVMTDKKGENIFNDIGNSLDNKSEIDAVKDGLFYNTLEQYVWFTNDKNKTFVFDKNPNLIKFNVSDIENYFAKENPFRIKELYTTDKHLITRGLIKND